jgi:hypothetical protein
MIPDWNKVVKKDNHLKVHLESFCENRDSLVIEDGYSPLFLSAVYHSKKLGVLPKGHSFSCCGLNFSTKHVEENLADINTRAWDNPPPAGEPVSNVVNHRSPVCPLCLFTIVLMDDEMFEHMLDEAKVAPTRLELDEQVTGNRRPFWKAVHANFVDDEYIVPNCQNHTLHLKIK